MLNSPDIHRKAWTMVTGPEASRIRKSVLAPAICPIPQRIFPDTLDVVFGEKMKFCVSDPIPQSYPESCALLGTWALTVQGANLADSDSLQRSLAGSRTFRQGTRYRSYLLTSHTHFQMFGVHPSPWTRLSQTKLIGFRL